ncbi:hypothetical protein ACQEVF_58375 [Nonomuraea polychroma]|uniref:hypothetical protein n=1 Tax=Nonomuraea polychroma TaxID=46176 RepID=UPI003D911DE9
MPRLQGRAISHVERVFAGDTHHLLSNPRRVVLADSPSTPDESRLMFNGVHCGKQVLRNWYVADGLEVPVGKLIADTAQKPVDAACAPPA